MAKAWRISGRPRRTRLLADDTLLLDTHVFAWWLLGSPRLAAVIHDTITGFPGRILVSTASLWEMALKHGRGRWPEMKPIMDDLAGVIAHERMLALPITVIHAHTAGMLAWDHGDPFDRMLAAQAIAEDATLVTADRAFAFVPTTAGLRTLWG